MTVKETNDMPPMQVPFCALFAVPIGIGLVAYVSFMAGAAFVMRFVRREADRKGDQ